MENARDIECPEPSQLRAFSDRLRAALALHDAGVAMKRAQLRRQDREASDAEIACRLAAWLRTRPGALLGDAEGIARSLADEL